MQPARVRSCCTCYSFHAPNSKPTAHRHLHFVAAPSRLVLHTWRPFSFHSLRPLHSNNIIIHSSRSHSSSLSLDSTRARVLRLKWRTTANAPRAIYSAYWNASNVWLCVRCTKSTWSYLASINRQQTKDNASLSLFRHGDIRLAFGQPPLFLIVRKREGKPSKWWNEIGFWSEIHCVLHLFSLSFHFNWRIRIGAHF